VEGPSVFLTSLMLGPTNQSVTKGRKMDLFDDEARLSEAKGAKEASMEQVEDHANPAWLNLMVEQVRIVCTKHRRFTVDDVMDRYDAIVGEKPTTHELRAMGPVMLRAAKAGYCLKANVMAVPSRRRKLHASPRAVWDSLIVGQ
jgi:hypothetical protein